jgi:hypothetical protein
MGSGAGGESAMRAATGADAPGRTGAIFVANLGA